MLLASPVLLRLRLAAKERGRHSPTVAPLILNGDLISLSRLPDLRFNGDVLRCPDHRQRLCPGVDD